MSDGDRSKEDWFLLQLEMFFYNLGEDMFGKPMPSKAPHWFPKGLTDRVNGGTLEP